MGLEQVKESAFEAAPGWLKEKELAKKLKGNWKTPMIML